MKHIHFLSRLLLIAALLFAPSLMADSHTLLMTRVQVEYIQIPLERMNGLLEEKGKSNNDDKLRDNLQKMIKSRDAKMIDTQMIVLQSWSQRANVASNEELIYPSEIDVEDISELIRKQKIVFFAPAIPTAFETRKLGSSLDITIFMGDYVNVNLALDSELAYYTRDIIYFVQKTKTRHTEVKMPAIYSARTKLDIVLEDGKYLMVAALSPKNEKGAADFSKKLLVFVKADVLWVEDNKHAE